MAGGAIAAEAALVWVFCLMTGITVGGCAYEDMIDMAPLARYVDVFAIQFIGG